MNDKICPKCGGELVLDEIFESYKHEDLCIGHCSSCKTDYEWVEKYKYAGISDIIEVK